MKDRIKHLMDTQHMTQQTFSDLIGVSPASLSNIFTGRTRPTLATVDAIRKKFPTLNLEWILYGHGPMFKDAMSATTVRSESDVASLEPSLDFDDSQNTALPQQGSGAPIASGTRNTLDSPSKVSVKYVDKPMRQITEIRVFFDDLTYESFVPKK